MFNLFKKKIIPHTCSIRLGGTTELTLAFGLGTMHQLTDGVNIVNVIVVGIHYDDILKIYSFDYVAVSEDYATM